MTSWFRGYAKLVLTGLLIISVGLVGVGAQKKKRRTHRAAKPAAPKPVITNPTIAPPSAGEATADGGVKIISTADQANETESSEVPQPRKPKSTTQPADQKDDMQQTINALSNQVNRLTDKLTQMQEDDRYQLDMERLTRAEQRAEQIRAQLVDTQSKIADLESKVEQVDYSLKPENIERSAQGMGTVHPEEVRESRRRQLESEKSRLVAQLKILETSKSRLELSQSTADSEVDTLRAKLEQRRAEMDATPAADTRPKKPE